MTLREFAQDEITYSYDRLFLMAPVVVVGNCPSRITLNLQICNRSVALNGRT